MPICIFFALGIIENPNLNPNVFKMWGMLKEVVEAYARYQIWKVVQWKKIISALLNLQKSRTMGKAKIKLVRARENYNSDVAEMIGLTERSVAEMTRSKESFPKWGKLAVLTYENMLENGRIVYDEEKK